MDVTIPIEDGDLCELLFDHKEELPDIFYIELMNMLKVYHTGGQNEICIYSFLVDHIDKIEPQLIKMFLTNFTSMLRRQTVVIEHPVSISLWPIVFVVVYFSGFLLYCKY
jgi:hypothetical protein